MTVAKPYVESGKHPLAAAKAYIALAGAVATGLLGSGFLGAVDADDPVFRVLTAIAAIATAIATYQFPNAEVAPIGADPNEPYDDGYEEAPETPAEYVPGEEVIEGEVVEDEPEVYLDPVLGEDEEMVFTPEGDPFADDHPVR